MALSLTSLEFIPFLGLALVLMWATARHPVVQRWLLLVCSYLFYLTFGVVGALVITITGLVDFNVARRLGETTEARTRLQLLWVSLSVNLGALIFFKYSAFLTGIAAAALNPVDLRIMAPDSLPVLVGLSYFTFAGMSYVLDTYYERITPAQTVSEYLSYLVYFPKLIAGPIVRAADLLPQLRRGVQISAQDIETGCAYLLVGAVKKLVIADQLASHVSMILAAPQHFNAFTLLQGMVGYTVQIYADFSGYSDMAIGCARLMGFRFPQNFQMPYSAVNIAEFWRRWHITLSTWLRDYVFMPLEMAGRGMRSANVRASRNIVVTMLVCGLWHGANWNFVVWGGLHGLALAVYQVYGNLKRRRIQVVAQSAFHPGKLLSRLLTLSVVMVGWVFFGTQNLSVAISYLSRMVTWSTDGVALGSPYILPLTALVIVTHLVINKDRNLVEELPTYSTSARVLSYASLLLALTCFVPSDTVPFAYVRF